MNLLLANDDGIDAPGLHALEAALEGLGTLWVVAPSEERSAQSHALTMHKPLFAKERGERRWSVSGTPADCVYLALHWLLPVRPDVVVSGINRGANLGHDVHYSGTVAGAREACLHGVPSVSVSLHTGPHRPRHWETASEVARRVVSKVAPDGPPVGVHWNVNVPDVPLGELKGLRAVPLGERRYGHQVETRTDPRGRTYHWIGGPPLVIVGPPEEDGPAVEGGWATITPLTVTPTHTPSLAVLRGWTDA